MHPKRPRGIPSEARWNESSKHWEAGSKRDGRSIGAWKFWDPNGTLRTERAWDDKGRSHGRHVSFHPDGALAYELMTEHGKMVRVTHFAAAGTRGKNRFAPTLPFTVDGSVVKAEYVPAPKAKYGWEWRLYDGAANQVDAEGKPLSQSRAVDAGIRGLAKQFAPRSGETFEQAIARANGWFEQLRSLRGKAVQQAYGRGSVAVRVLEKPATRGQVTSLERWIGGSLPPSYSRFLLAHGGMAFIDRIDTERIAEIRVASERYTERSFAETFEHDRRLPGRAWTTGKPDVAVGFTAKELVEPAFIKIAAADGGAYLLVPHARDRKREAPVVRHHSDDETTDLFFAGRSFDEWVSRRVDAIMEELTEQFA